MEYESWKADGYEWAYDQNGAHFWQKQVGHTGRYLLMKLVAEDLTYKNFLCMTRHDLSRPIAPGDLD